ncbi:uncharacterized protein STEHIDRAFT_145678 [Stereum hirsutum FP-91666 SS1]|uniref:uncharacterized protein n=1 Tax=Stereum hirsutum (strain FP-91666) TaxID=721885 RepID=UPI000440F98A|nr:uncharacterized protein STEHIDRAFT_145678 [Stereum hirsutum FP-91666 SS1]EIM88840.1 hypothetical protein STEHIDRAFT_145678 [Stereum hirsutum FP-91666 SS1]
MRIKECLNKTCASRNISVVITMQLSTKLLNRDGTPGNFDTGSRAVLVPQLGPTYLPSGRTHRVIVVPQTRTTGILRLLSSPSNLHGSKGQAELVDEPYEMVDGKMLSPQN